MKSKIKLSLFFFLSCICLMAADPTPKFVSNIEGVKEYALDNGMQILLLPDNSQNNMIVNIVYKVGSRHEGYGETGMAHLLEHMLFKSTENLGDIKKQLTEKGGNANGTTWYDRTNYYEIFPSSNENLEWSIMMEADRMLNATIKQEDLDKEFSVVRNEFEIGENDPSSILQERIVSTGFLWHNYGKSTIGSKEDIERVKADRLKKFYKKYYQPNNATLIIAGNFDEEKALEYVAKYFGILEAGPEIDHPYTVEPAQDGERYVELKRSGDLYFAGAMYHTVPYSHSDYAAINALEIILTSEPSGYMYKSLIETQKASSIYAWQPTTRDASYLYFNLEIPKDNDLEDAKNNFLADLDNIGNINYNEKDLERAKAKLVKQYENIINNTLYKAISMTEIIGAGDYKLFFLYRDAVEALTLDDIRRVAKKYFSSNNRTYGVFIPSDDEVRVPATEMSDDQILALTKDYKGREVEEEDLSFEPTISNVKANLSEGQLPNGMKYAFLSKPIKGKKVLARYSFPTGTLESLKGKVTTAKLMASMLKSGTKNKTREQIQDELDKLKSSVSFWWGGQNLGVSISTYQQYLPQVMAIVNECLSESTFPESELEKIKLENKASIEYALKDPQSIAFDRLSIHNQPYEKDHIFYNQTPEEQLEAETHVTRDQIEDFYKTFVGANNGFGTMVGKVDYSEVQNLLNSTFGDISTSSKYSKVERQAYEPTEKTEVVLTPDKENAVAAGRIAFELDQSSSDYPAMLMVNEILGGGFITSRIPYRLRETEGISYGAGSFMNIPYTHTHANMGVYAFFNPSKKTDVENGLKEEIMKAVSGDFTSKELDEARVSWENSRKTWFTNDNQMINMINQQLENDKKIESFDILGEKVSQLTASDLNAAVKKYINPKHLYMVLAGDFDKE